jgi:hypothetical protein
MKTIASALFVVLLPFAATASAQTRVHAVHDGAAQSARALPLTGGHASNVHVRPRALSPRAGRVAQHQKIGSSPGARAARLRRAVAEARERGIEIDARQLRRLQQRVR